MIRKITSKILYTIKGIKVPFLRKIVRSFSANKPNRKLANKALSIS